MQSVVALLQNFEKIIYKILMAIILIPKTLVAVTLDPLWFRGYIKKEEKDESPFDEYLSPVILLLVVAFLPAIAYNALPVYGTVLTSPAETNPTTDRFLSFESVTDFKSTSTKRMEYVHTWVVSKKQTSGNFVEVYNDVHTKAVGSLEQKDINPYMDRFFYTFAETGEYDLTVKVEKVDVNSRLVIEDYTASLLVNVPALLTNEAKISRNETETPGASKEAVVLMDVINQEETIFLALGLMIPPLLFAFASRVFMDKKVLERLEKESAANETLTLKKEAPISGKSSEKIERVSIGEETLKQSFYIQCYYFSPLSLSIWGTFYASYFFTKDVFPFQSDALYWQVILLPLVLCVMWFFRTEVKYFQLERNTTGVRAVAIALACIVAVGLGALAVFSFADLQDILRVWAIRSFPMIAVLLVLMFLIAWYRRRRVHNEVIIGSNGAGLVAVSVLFFVAMTLIPSAMNIINPSNSSGRKSQLTAIANVPADSGSEAVSTQSGVESSPTPILAQATPTALLVQPTPTLFLTPTSTPSPFYTDDFNGDLATWFDFMTSGDPRMVERNVELGRLTLKLFQLEDKLPRYYLIKDTFIYSDVKVEAVVTNKGNNTNGVSLICRYSEIGWYEFVISNSGSYQIYAMDASGIVSQGYNPFVDANSTAIKSGPGAVNVYTVTCQGDKLELTINGKLVRTINDTKFNLLNGKIGIGVSSPRKLPTWIEFESLTVSEP